MFAMPSEEIEIRRELVDLIACEDDPDARALLAELLAFGEVEVDEESPYRVGIDVMALLDDRQVAFEEIGAGIRRYSI